MENPLRSFLPANFQFKGTFPVSEKPEIDIDSFCHNNPNGSASSNYNRSDKCMQSSISYINIFPPNHLEGKQKELRKKYHDPDRLALLH